MDKNTYGTLLQRFTTVNFTLCMDMCVNVCVCMCVCSSRVDFSATLDLQEFMCEESVCEGDGTVKYELLSVLNHHGEGTECGHYTATVPFALTPECPEKKRWAFFSDEYMTQCTQNTLDANVAYVLYYRKKQS